MAQHHMADGGALDRNGLEVLTRGECLELLSSATLGRIGLSTGALPLVLPVNFCVDDDHIVLRTGAGSKLEAASRNAVVSFEVDDIDPMSHSGWSVVITGIASPVESEADLAHVRTLPLRPWAMPGDRYVTISIEDLSGRRVGPPAPGPRPRVAWR